MIRRDFAWWFLVGIVGTACAPVSPIRTGHDTEAAELAALGEKTDGEPEPCRYGEAEVNAFSVSCEQGERNDCLRAAVSRWRGCGGCVDLVRAEEGFARACKLGSQLGCSMQATVMMAGPRPRVPESLALYEGACAAGVQRACGNVGVMLTTRVPDPTPIQIDRGVGLVQNACAAGFHNFCSALGPIVAQWKLRTRFDETRRLMRSSCETGNLGACFSLAMAMKEGTLGTRRLDEGAHWASVACERGHLPSCNELGYMLVNGEGIEKNQTAGAALFYSACERGFAVACDSMGEAIENGWGFPADPVKAREFYNHACSMGNEYSCKRADPAPTRTESDERQ